MSERVKELEKQITEMIEHFNMLDLKKKALKELDDIRKNTKRSTVHTAYIVHQYPDFNSITFSVTKPNTFVLKISVNVDALKGNKKAIHNAAKMINQWLKAGGTINE